MDAVRLDLEVRVGEPWREELQFFEDDGSTYLLNTADEVKLILQAFGPAIPRKEFSKTAGQIQITPAEGKVRFNFSASDTRSLVFSGRYELRHIPQGGESFLLAYGRIYRVEPL